MPHIHELFDFTVSAFIIHPTEKKICLHYHKKLHKWLQPGGHIELNEDPLQALMHEIEEETGLKTGEYEIISAVDQPNTKDSKQLPIPFNFNVHNFNESHKHIDLEYIVKSKVAQFKPADNESKQIEWVSKLELSNMASSGLLFKDTLNICEWVFDHYM